MAVLRMEAFAQYDGVSANLLAADNGWAAFTGDLVVGAGRDGGDCLRIPFRSNDVSFTAGARIALPAATNEGFIHFAHLTPQYPDASNIQQLLEAFTIAGVSGPVFSIYINTAGGLDVYDSADTLLGSSANGVITTGAQQAICVHYKRHASTGIVQVYVNQVSILNLTGLNLGATDPTLITFCRNIRTGGGAYSVDLMDVFINDTNIADDNTGFMGDPRLVFLRARADYAANQGWTPQRRYQFGTGVLSLPANNSAISAADASAMRVGAGDFTIETRWHPTALPTGSNKASFFGKWLETGDLRSWRLFYGGPSLNSSHLELQVSTDGAAGTITSPISVSWSPVVGRSYDIALQVESGLATLYIDGVRQNAPVAFPTPAANSSLFFIGGQQSNSLGTPLANASAVGYMDEIRFTKGVARYGSGYTPATSEFGRNSTDDPDYSSVVILAGFNNSIVDESAAPRVLTAVGGAVRYAPDDGPPNNYPVILHGDRDDTFVEAPYLPADGIQTFTVLPSDGDTVGCDGETYTLKSPFVNSAGNVLIGATIDDTINNLVAAMNGDAGAGTLYGTGTNPLTNASALNRGADQLEVSANTLGSAGNSIAVSSSNASNPWSAATLTGGADIPGPSSFILDRLPPHTVTVLAATLIHRSRKTDSGDANVQPALVTNDGSSENGVDQPLTTNFVFYNSIITQDPATLSGLTPSSFINARIRLDRTA